MIQSDVTSRTEQKKGEKEGERAKNAARIDVTFSKKNDAFDHFFLSVYNITNTVMRQQWQVKRKLFEIALEAEYASESESRSETPSLVPSTFLSTSELPYEMVPMKREIPSSFPSTLSLIPEHSSGLVSIRFEMTSTLYLSPPEPSGGLARTSEYTEFSKFELPPECNRHITCIIGLRYHRRTLTFMSCTDFLY